MEKAFKYRIYPNKKQKELINKTFGCCRFVYNTYLAKRTSLYKGKGETYSYVQCAKDMKILKDELPWLREVDSTALQSALKDLGSAYQNFFQKRARYPKFKSKKTNRHSYQSKHTNGNIAYQGKRIKLPKLGLVKTKNKLVPQGRILSATVSKEPSGKYYVSLCCTDVNISLYQKTGSTVGIDLGITNFATTSKGDIIANPKYLNQSLKKLAKLQKELSRKSIGSSNRNKARLKVARQHEVVANQRKDYLHKLSSHLIRTNDVICIEDLSVQNMIQSRKLAQSISDASWSEFVRQLEYKAFWHHKQIVKIGTFFPSSQICNLCGHKNTHVKHLSVRSWECSGCHTHHDRDANASLNILKEGLRLLSA